MDGTRCNNIMSLLIPWLMGLLPTSYTVSELSLFAARIFVLLGAFFIPISTSAMHVALGCACGITLLFGHCNKLVKSREPLVFLLAGLAALSLIGMLYSDALYSYQLKAFSKYTKFLLLLCLIPCFTDKDWRMFCLFSFAVGLTVTLVFALAKALGFSHFNMRFGPVAMFKDHIHTGLFLALLAYILAHESTMQPKLRGLFITLALLASFTTLMLLDSRTGYIIFILLLALFCWQKASLRGLAIATTIGISLLCLCYTLSPFARDAMHGVVQETQAYLDGREDSSTALRLSFAHKSLHIMREHPLTGLGTGGFTLPEDHVKQGVFADNPHNEFFNAGVQFGIIGILWLLAIFYFAWRLSFRLDRRLNRWLQGIVLAIAIGSLGNSWLMDTTEGHLFAFFVAIALGYTLEQSLYKPLKPQS